MFISELDMLGPLWSQTIENTEGSKETLALHFAQQSYIHIQFFCFFSFPTS